MPVVITCAAALNLCFNVSGVELLFESILTHLECFDDNFATKAKERFTGYFQGLYNTYYLKYGNPTTQSTSAASSSTQSGDMLSVQATLVASESFFSTSGWVLSIRRTRLTPASLEMCMCLKDHFDSQDRIQNTSSLEHSLDFEEDILEEEVQDNEVIPLSDEEIVLDEAASKVMSNGSGSGGEDVDLTLSESE
ncbi:zinc finger BED domain-containing protein RICESLEEPER 2 [Tanacetum coccineum]